MRPFALAAVTTFAVLALGCGGGDPAPVAPTEAAAPETDGAPEVSANPQVFFVQIDT